MKFISLGSGSSGNCYYIQEENQAIIIDQGIGIRKFKVYCNQFGIKTTELAAMLVTHDHTDHVRGVGVTSQHLQVPVYTTANIHRGMMNNRLMSKKIAEEHIREVKCHEPFEIGPFTIVAFEVPHDATQNIGYFITTSGNSFCLMTDCGSFTPDMQKYISMAENLVIEANYDDDMLDVGPYPQRLKNRIRSGFGHASNKMTGLILQHSISEKLRRIWLCHLSEENNEPTICKTTIENALMDKKGVHIEVLPRKRPVVYYDI